MGCEDDQVARGVKNKIEDPSDWGSVWLLNVNGVSGEVSSYLPLCGILVGGYPPSAVLIRAGISKKPNVVVAGECEAQSRR